jgi:glycosyltransferase domain-containing protein
MSGDRDDGLTIVMPTRNRSSLLSAQLQFFSKCGVSHQIIVADSSDAEQAAAVRAACSGIAEHLPFESDLLLADKVAEVLRTVQTSHVALVSDDDIYLPHAIDAAFAHLRANPDCVAAHGYALTFAFHGNDVDLSAVRWFTPSIEEHDPLRRHYHLMRRYQPFYWAVFCTPTASTAFAAARAVTGPLFREVTVMNTVVLQGKIARLPVIYSLRRGEQSLTPAYLRHPLFWFLHDASSFFAHYNIYRNALAKFIRDRNISVPKQGELEQLLDIIHATWLGHEIDTGMCNHTARRLLGDDLPPISAPPDGPPWQPPGNGDNTRQSEIRSYIWRKAVLEAEPRHEINITPAEMDRVERQLDAYSVPG